MKTFSLILLTLALLAFAGMLAARFTALPPDLAAGSQSAARLQPGPFAVGYQDVTLTDRSRPTDANKDFAGSPVRVLQTRVWFPLDKSGNAVAEGLHPLVIHSHGFSSDNREGGHIGRHLASYGYVVMSATYPLTSMRAPGGPNIADVLNQPGDVSFLISMALKWNHATGHMFHERIDETRIAATGISLGGLTTTLAAYHPRLRDPRLRAAISIAGPSTMFGPEYFSQVAIPFMMIAGDVDAILPYARNAAPMVDKDPSAILLTIKGASHTGFADPARWLRWLKNPDWIGCTVVKHRKPEDTPADFLAKMQDGSLGIIDDRRNDLCVMDPLPPAMNVLRQHQLSLLAIRAFLDSELADTQEARVAARDFLLKTLPAEQAEIAVTAPH